MSPLIKNILAVIAGIIIGGVVNMGIIMVSGYVIPPPEGVDVSNMESLGESMHLFEPKHFIMPFLAHAFGTLAGAMTTAFVASSNKLKLSLVIGVFFLLGGIYSVLQLPSPVWFNILDLVGAYIPMAWLGVLIVEKLRQ